MCLYIFNKFWPEANWKKCYELGKLQAIQEAPVDLYILCVPSVLCLHDHPTLLYLLLVLGVPVTEKVILTLCSKKQMQQIWLLLYARAHRCQ